MVKAASKRQHGSTTTTTTTTAISDAQQQQPTTRASTRGAAAAAKKAAAAAAAEEEHQQHNITDASTGGEPVRKRRIASLNAELLVHYSNVQSSPVTGENAHHHKPRRRTESNDSKGALPTNTNIGPSKPTPVSVAANTGAAAKAKLTNQVIFRTYFLNVFFS